MGAAAGLRYANVAGPDMAQVRYLKIHEADSGGVILHSKASVLSPFICTSYVQCMNLSYRRSWTFFIFSNFDYLRPLVLPLKNGYLAPDNLSTIFQSL